MDQATTAGSRATSSSKKRKRLATTEGVSTGMPEIVGVPPSLIPLLVQALRSTHRFLAHHPKAIPPNYYMLQQQRQEPSSTLPRVIGTPDNTVNKDDNNDNNSDSTNLMPRATRRQGTGTGTGTAAEVVDNILHRLHESNPAEREQKRKQQQREDQMMQAIQSWLREMAFHARSSKSTTLPQQQTPSNNSDPNFLQSQQQHQSHSSQQQQQLLHHHHNHHPSVPLACFQFVWELQWPESNESGLPPPRPQQRSVTARRAALHMAGLLLQKSSECRQYWCRGGEAPPKFSIRAWIQQCLCHTETSTASVEESSMPSTPSTLRLYQQEAHLLLQFLLQEGYGDLYPQLQVAQRLLQQTCPAVLVLSNDDDNNDNINSNVLPGNNSQWEWRRHRDLAMKYVAQETAVVHKLVQRAQACLHILAPSWDGITTSGTTVTAATPYTKVAAVDTNGNSNHPKDNVAVDDVDDDDDVDWEDGYDEDPHGDEPPLFDLHNKNKNNRNKITDKPSEDHQNAVERTLALMKAAGSVRGGQIEIAFNDNQHQDDDLLPIAESSETLAAVEQARTRLQRCIRKLHQVHMPRLSVWVEGLTYADGLVQVVGGGSSWILMPSNQVQMRGHVQSQLLGLKQMVASVLASAARLGITQPSAKTLGSSNNSESNPSRHQPAASTHFVAPTRNLIRNASSSLKQYGSGQRRSATPSSASLKSKRFHRIQIQYRNNK